jgi:hypothetical protein
VRIPDHHLVDAPTAVDQHGDNPVDLLGDERELMGELPCDRFGRWNPASMQLFEFLALTRLQAGQVTVNITSSDR